MRIAEGTNFFESKEWPYIGVFLYDEDVERTVERIQFAYENEVPVYIRYSDFGDKALAVHKVIRFMWNIGAVLINVSLCNGRYIPDAYAAFKIKDYHKNINMSQHGDWSPLASVYYDRLVDKGEIERASWVRTFEYDFPMPYEAATLKVKEL